MQKHSIQHKVHGFSILTKTTFSLHMHKILLSHHRMNQRTKYIAFIDQMLQDSYSFLFECPQSSPSISHTEEGRTSRSSHLSISWSFIHACSTRGGKSLARFCNAYLQSSYEIEEDGFCTLHPGEEVKIMKTRVLDPFYLPLKYHR